MVRSPSEEAAGRIRPEYACRQAVGCPAPPAAPREVQVTPADHEQPVPGSARRLGAWFSAPMPQAPGLMPRRARIRKRLPPACCSTSRPEQRVRRRQRLGLRITPITQLAGTAARKTDSAWVSTSVPWRCPESRPEQQAAVLEVSARRAELNRLTPEQLGSAYERRSVQRPEDGATAPRHSIGASTTHCNARYPGHCSVSVGRRLIGCRCRARR